MVWPLQKMAAHKDFQCAGTFAPNVYISIGKTELFPACGLDANFPFFSFWKIVISRIFDRTPIYSLNSKNHKKNNDKTRRQYHLPNLNREQKLRSQFLWKRTVSFYGWSAQFRTTLILCILFMMRPTLAREKDPGLHWFEGRICKSSMYGHVLACMWTWRRER